MTFLVGVSSQEKSSSLEVPIAQEPLRESLQMGRLPQLTSAFPMIHGKCNLTTIIFVLSRVRYSCGIDLGDYFVVTGGHPGIDTVAQYSETGSYTYLTVLNEGRYRHACSKFVDLSGKTVR